MKQSPLRRATVAVAILAIGTAIGVSIGYARWHEPFDRYANARRIVMHRADDFPQGGVLLIGDSTAERLHLPEICGTPVFNAGISGARADQLAPIAKPLIEKLAPRTVIVMAGTNDRIQNDPWQDDIAGFAPRGAVVVGVPVALAQANGWRVVDALPASLLAADGIHHSPAGRAEMKRRLSRSMCDSDV
jgi:lysophospholipase L1-like esterase